MRKETVNSIIENGLAKDFKVILFMRMKNKTNNIIKDVDYVEEFDNGNYIIIGMENGTRLTFNCDDIFDIYLRS